MLNGKFWDRQRHLGHSLSARRVIHCPKCGVWGVKNVVGEQCHECEAVVWTKLKKETKMTCIWEHRFEWDGGGYTCLDCGMMAASTDPLIAPCIACGAAVDADGVYCQECNGENANGE